MMKFRNYKVISYKVFVKLNIPFIKVTGHNNNTRASLSCGAIVSFYYWIVGHNGLLSSARESKDIDRHRHKRRPFSQAFSLWRLWRVNPVPLLTSFIIFWPICVPNEIVAIAPTSGRGCLISWEPPQRTVLGVILLWGTVRCQKRA